MHCRVFITGPSLGAFVALSHGYVCSGISEDSCQLQEIYSTLILLHWTLVLWNWYWCVQNHVTWELSEVRSSGAPRYCSLGCDLKRNKSEVKQKHENWAREIFIMFSRKILFFWKYVFCHLSTWQCDISPYIIITFHFKIILAMLYKYL